MELASAATAVFHPDATLDTSALRVVGPEPRERRLPGAVRTSAPGATRTKAAHGGVATM